MIRIRKNFGSYPILDMVFAYDPQQGIVLGRFRTQDNQVSLGEVSIKELEALDEKGEFQSLDRVLRSRTWFTLENEVKHG